jgi:hypothetical protein
LGHASVSTDGEHALFHDAAGVFRGRTNLRNWKSLVEFAYDGDGEEVYTLRRHVAPYACA